MKTYAVVKDSAEFRAKVSRWLLHKAEMEKQFARITTKKREQQAAYDRAIALERASKELDEIEICHEQPQIGGSASFL